MACQKNVILLTISVVSSAIALTGTLIGIIGEAWVSKEGEKHGLWRRCNRTDCRQDQNILTFKDERKEEDVMLILLIFGCAFGVLALCELLLMCCCEQHTKCWLFWTFPVLFLTGLAASTTVTALIYAEVHFKPHFLKGYQRGWSIIGGWIGSIAFVMVFCIDFMLLRWMPEQPLENNSQRIYGVSDISGSDILNSKSGRNSNAESSAAQSYLTHNVFDRTH